MAAMPVGQAAADEVSAEAAETLDESAVRLGRTDAGYYVRAATLGHSYSEFALDDVGTANPRNAWVDSRLIVGLGLDMGSLRLELAVEGLSGPVLGDTTALGLARGGDTFNTPIDEHSGRTAVIPQRASLRWRSSVGVLSVGHQSFQWGLGILAQDGRVPPDFGMAMRNNLVERVAFGTKPFSKAAQAPDWFRDLSVFVGADLVFRDDNASLLDGDLAGGGVLGLRVVQPTWSVGLLESVRVQRDRADAAFPPGLDSTLQVATTDLYASLPLVTDSQRVVLGFESEVALVLGQTTRPYLEETFEDGSAVRSLGAVGRLNYKPSQAFEVKLEGGYASGDNDPRDDRFSVFSFHTDYNVGMILFDQVLPMLSARALDRIHDPALVRQAPPSTRFLVNQGAVRDARYLYPVIRYRPLQMLELRAAYLLALNAADVMDPFQTAINGGFAHGFDGEPTASRSKLLGHEFAAGARLSLGQEDGLRARLGVEGGVLLPGAALEVLGQSTITAARVGMEVLW